MALHWNLGFFLSLVTTFYFFPLGGRPLPLSSQKMGQTRTRFIQAMFSNKCLLQIIHDHSCQANGNDSPQRLLKQTRFISQWQHNGIQILQIINHERK